MCDGREVFALSQDVRGGRQRRLLLPSGRSPRRLPDDPTVAAPDRPACAVEPFEERNRLSPAQTELVAELGDRESVVELPESERDLVDPVDELWRRRVIREQGFTYDFSHDKLRAVALEMTSPARRRQFHRAVAEAIAQDRDSFASSQMAAHYDRAGMTKEAIDAYRVAGTRAVAVSALDEAVAILRTLDRFFARLLESRPAGASLLVTSDHGNVEAMDHRLHTDAPVPTLIWGPLGERIEAAAIETLQDITPLIVGFLEPRS